MDQQTADRLQACLADLRATNRYREMRPGQPLPGGKILRDGRQMLNLSSNDYLGLAHHRLLTDRAADWAERWGIGATASRLVCGSFEAHQQIEQKIARLKGAAAGLVLNAGFQANQAVIAALLAADFAGPAPQVFADRLIHASMYEGLRAAGVTPRRFRHNDPSHLDQLLHRHPVQGSLRLILVESVYSMDGDRADLAALAAVAEAHEAFLYVDEAHATGVLGPQGRGLTAEVEGRVDLVMGIFGKALGGFGAYVATSQALRDYLVNRCSGLIQRCRCWRSMALRVFAAAMVKPRARPRLLARMRARLNDAPQATLDAFRARCGASPAQRIGLTEALAEGLAALHGDDARPALAGRRVFALAGSEDPIVPPSLALDAFGGDPALTVWWTKADSSVQEV